MPLCTHTFRLKEHCGYIEFLIFPFFEKLLDNNIIEFISGHSNTIYNKKDLG